jgi:hypothetical protein
MIDWLYTIKNKHLRWLAALAVLIAITVWVWLSLRPLGYSYSEAFLGLLVVSLAARRLHIAWEEWQQKRRYERLIISRE